VARNRHCFTGGAGLSSSSRFDEFEIEYYITELARGDYDGDGNEDALIEIGWHTGGKMGWS